MVVCWQAVGMAFLFRMSGRLGACSVPTLVGAQETAAPAALVFGQSAALTGPASELGLGMRQGLLAAFEEANRNGGVHGRRLSLVTLDDAYEPEAAITNTRTLIEEVQALALIGAVGTPTSGAAQPVAAEAGVPYIAPFTGAEFLREADIRPNVVNVRASYFRKRRRSLPG